MPSHDYSAADIANARIVAEALEQSGDFKAAAPFKAKIAHGLPAAPSADRDAQISQLKQSITDHESRREFAVVGRLKIRLAQLQTS